MTGNQNLVVRRSEWSEGDIALLSGIANAGGGSVLISPTTSNHSRQMKRFRKSFETIPRISQQELGIVCTTEPVMDGVELCLEIQVPAAETPIRYRNNYYLYADGINTIVTKELLNRFFFTTKSTSAEAENGASSSVVSSDISLDGPSDTQVETAEANTLETLSAGNDRGKAAQKPQIELSPVQAKASPAAPATASDQPHKQTFKEHSIAAANRLDMTSTDEYILKVLETNGRVTAIRIAEVLGVSESTVRRSFRRLREYGLIERIGSNKAGYWRVVD